MFGPNKIQPTTGAILGDSTERVDSCTSLGPGTASQFQVLQSYCLGEMLYRLAAPGCCSRVALSEMLRGFRTSSSSACSDSSLNFLTPGLETPGIQPLSLRHRAGEEDDPEEEEQRTHATLLQHRPEKSSPARHLGGLGGVGRFVMVLHCHGGLKIVQAVLDAQYPQVIVSLLLWRANKISKAKLYFWFYF